MNLLCLLGMHYRSRDLTRKRGKGYQSRCEHCDRVMVREADGRWRALKILRLETGQGKPAAPRPRSALWQWGADGSVELPVERKPRAHKPRMHKR